MYKHILLNTGHDPMATVVITILMFAIIGIYKSLKGQKKSLEGTDLSNTNQPENNFPNKCQQGTPEQAEKSTDIETYKTKQGELILIREHSSSEYTSADKKIIKAMLNGQTAPDDKYKLGFMWYVSVIDGYVASTTFF